MTIHLRILSAPAPADLGGTVGVCLVGWAEVVGVWGTGPVREVVYLGDWCEENV